MTLTPQPVERMKKLDHDKGAAWCRILRAARERDALGKTLLERFSLKQVAMQIGTSPSTLCRLLKDFGHLADHELTPERLAPVRDGGRDCEWKFLLEIAEVRAKILAVAIATMGASSASAANDRRTMKIATALEHFAFEPECPDALKTLLRGGYQPAPFVRFLNSAVTPEMEAKIRGPKHYRLYGPSSRREWTNRLVDGCRYETPARESLSMDDMSINHPFFVQRADGEVILSRQGIYALWAKHKVWQACELVARKKESYTAADILRAFYKMCLALGGVPPFVEFEQGIWKAKLITGFLLDAGWLVEESFERPALAGADKLLIESGLSLAGVQVLYKTSAHQKHIETNFNPLQTALGITARDYLCIGRYAGEFEKPGKQLRRVRAGSHSPGELGFGSAGQIIGCIEEAFRRINTKTSQVLGPNGQPLTRAEAHWDDIARFPLLPLNARLFAACLPGEMKKTTVRDGAINVQCKGVEYQYRHEDMIKLGDGYQLFYKIDETEPNLGAAIFNRTAQTNGANFQNWPPGDFMFKAAREIPAPHRNVITAPEGVTIQTVEERFGAGAVDTGDTARRAQDKFVSTRFVSMPRPGQNSVRGASVRDGKGNVVEVTRGTGVSPVSSEMETRRQDARATIGSDPAAALPPRPVHTRADQRRRQAAADEALCNISE